jgi:mRNA-degrading endonuclease RelE of RelBE toxin-antitoxin system
MGTQFTIDLSPDAQEQLDAFTARERRTLLDAIDDQLSYQPLVRTRNRKPLAPNDLATWELRVGGLRVFYDVETEPETIVWIRAIGRKIGNRLYLGGKEIKL